jgi:hypothetical protein
MFAVAESSNVLPLPESPKLSPGATPPDALDRIALHRVERAAIVLRRVLKVVWRPHGFATALVVDLAREAAHRRLTALNEPRSHSLAVVASDLHALGYLS